MSTELQCKTASNNLCVCVVSLAVVASWQDAVRRELTELRVAKGARFEQAVAVAFLLERVKAHFRCTICG